MKFFNKNKISPLASKETNVIEVDFEAKIGKRKYVLVEFEKNGRLYVNFYNTQDVHDQSVNKDIKNAKSVFSDSFSTKFDLEKAKEKAIKRFEAREEKGRFWTRFF